MKFFGLIAMMALICAGLNSCSGGYNPEDAKEMLKKYEDGKMTEADFTTCIDWAEVYVDECVKEVEDAMKKSENAKDFDKVMKGVEEKMDEKYPNMKDITSMLSEAAAKQDKAMGKKNIDRWNKIQEDFMKKIKEMMGNAMGSAMSE